MNTTTELNEENNVTSTSITSSTYAANFTPNTNVKDDGMLLLLDDQRTFNYIMCGVSVGILIIVIIVARCLFLLNRRIERRNATVMTTSVNHDMNRHAWNNKTYPSSSSSGEARSAQNDYINKKQDDFGIKSQQKPGGINPKANFRDVSPTNLDPGALPTERILTSRPARATQQQETRHHHLLVDNTKFQRRHKKMAHSNQPPPMDMPNFIPDNEPQSSDAGPEKNGLKRINEDETNPLRSNVDDFLTRLESQLEFVVRPKEKTKTVTDVKCAPPRIELLNTRLVT